MKTNIESPGKLQRKVHVELPQEVVKVAFQRVYESIQRDVSIKGFRKGKAPIATIKSLYKERVQMDVSQDLIQRHYPKALSELKVDPITYPEFEFEDAQEDKEFKFSAEFDIRPDVELSKYEGLHVEKEKQKDSTERLEKILENIRASHAKMETEFEDRPAKIGDVAVLDFEGSVNGEPLPNGKGENHTLELGSNSFIEGFEEGIVGMKPGQEKTIQLKFPDPYHAAELAGKPVDFKVKLKEIKKKVLPELNDEFVKETLKMESLEKLKSSILADIQKEEEKRIADKYKNNLLKALVRANPIEVPPKMVEEQKKNLIADFRKRFEENKAPEAEIEEYVSKWDKDFESTAREMVQVSFLIDAVAKKHDFLCTREDIDQKFAEYATQTGIDVARIREFYSKDETISRLSYTITEEKVLAYLTSKADIQMVEPKDEEAEATA